MNTNSNTYTIIYSTVMVVIVAAVLAYVSVSLSGKQQANVNTETAREPMRLLTRTHTWNRSSKNTSQTPIWSMHRAIKWMETHSPSPLQQA